MTVQPVHHPYARHRWPSLAAVLVTLLYFAAFHPAVPAQDRKPAGTNLRMTVSETPGRNNGQRTTDLPPATLSSPVVLWDNGPFNNVDGLISMEGVGISARTADDFVLTSSATIQTITFDIYANTPATQQSPNPAPWTFMLTAAESGRSTPCRWPPTPRRPSPLSGRVLVSTSGATR